MPHIAPTLSVAAHVRAHRRIALAALLALFATAAVVLVLAAGDSASTDSVGDRPVSAVRADGGLEESAVAATIGSQPSVGRPDESGIAAAIGSSSKASLVPSRPDESAVAAAISGR